MQFKPEVVAPEKRSEPAWWFAFREHALLVTANRSKPDIPCLVDFSELGLRTVRDHYLGRLNGRHCYTVEVPGEIAPPKNMAFQGLRALFDRLNASFWEVAGLAAQIIEWDRSHEFCGRCGSPTVLGTADRVKTCEQCGKLHFPRVSPAVIVLVERGNQVLLARSRHFYPGMYSIIAGFVEPGETLEEAVAREVKEETGVAVRDIRYFGSQPWPFPHSLMVGFTAQYAAGKLVIDHEELEDAGWFTVDNLPRLPTKISIARKILEWFISSQTNSPQGTV